MRLGLLLFVAVAVYAALGTVPLGPLFDVLGGQDHVPERTLRFLPWVDLRESEYYSTAVFGGLLVAIVVNMSLATVLRIRWEWKRIGVLLTHGGVIVLAAGTLIATRNPLNATMALFADEPTSEGLDRSHTLLATGPALTKGAIDEEWRVDELLPRYADFGVPWSPDVKSIDLDGRFSITGYAHSARLVPRLEAGPEGSPQGWQITERLRTGESRTITLLSGHSAHSSATLTNGMPLFMFESPIIGLETGVLDEINEPAVLIKVEGTDEPLNLPADPGATATLETPAGAWEAEYLDRANFGFVWPMATISLSGPGFPKATVFASPWNVGAGAILADGSDGTMELVDLALSVRVLFCDPEQDVVVLSRNGWIVNRRGGGVLTGSTDLQPGFELPIDRSTSLTVDLALDHARVVETLERIPFVEDAQLLADPRLGSLVRVRVSIINHDGLGTWIAFDELGATGDGSAPFTYKAAPFVIDDATVTYRGFEAALFRRGSVPRDFRVNLELARGDETSTHALSLNEPVRVTMDIDGRTRRVQLSLIGWDSEGWEARRAGSEDRFEGTRFVIVAVTQREGVGIAITGGVLILLGAGVSVVGRMLRSRPRAEAA